MHSMQSLSHPLATSSSSNYPSLVSITSDEETNAYKFAVYNEDEQMKRGSESNSLEQQIQAESIDFSIKELSVTGPVVLVLGLFSSGLHF